MVAVPILEELFWRGWLMRYLIDSNHFEKIALGTFTPLAFWAVAALFASEHGSFWDVGLVTGILYNCVAHPHAEPLGLHSGSRSHERSPRGLRGARRTMAVLAVIPRQKPSYISVP